MATNPFNFDDGGKKANFYLGDKTTAVELENREEGTSVQAVVDPYDYFAVTMNVDTSKAEQKPRNAETSESDDDSDEHDMTSFRENVIQTPSRQNSTGDIPSRSAGIPLSQSSPSLAAIPSTSQQPPAVVPSVTFAGPLQHTTNQPPINHQVQQASNSGLGQQIRQTSNSGSGQYVQQPTNHGSVQLVRKTSNSGPGHYVQQSSNSGSVQQIRKTSNSGPGQYVKQTSNPGSVQQVGQTSNSGPGSGNGMRNRRNGSVRAEDATLILQNLLQSGEYTLTTTSSSNSINSNAPVLTVTPRPKMGRSVSTGSFHPTIHEESESEASGSARVTPVQQRRRQVPNKHPHRRGRKVSAPPELQPHLGPHSVHQPKKHAQGGAITDTTDSSPHQEYVININSGNNHISEGLYSGSDSGVTSEYSSWSVPVNGHQRPEQSAYEDDLTSPVGSVEDLINDHSRRQKDKYFTSDSESEVSSPLSSRRRGMNNAAYVNTEPRPLVLSVDAPPPPLNRSLTDTNLVATQHNVMSSATNSPAQSGTLQRPRTNSMVVQLHLGGNENQGMPGSQASTLPNGRSVSLVSLNQAGINSSPNVNNYPNLSGYSNDTQSIYSEIGGQYNTGYLGTHHMNNVMGSQGSLSGHKDLGISQAPMPSGEEDGPEPTSEEYKKSWTIETLVDNLSLIYALFLVTLGIAIYLADTFSGHDSAIAETFNVFLIVVQLIWLGYAHIDVRHYLQTIMKAMDEARERNKDKNDQVVLEPTGDGQYQLRINLPEPKKTIPQHYGFTSGRHGGSLYLKIGATVFCFGHLIHTGLNLGQKILYLTNDDPAFDNCTCTQDVLMSVLQPIYAFYNLFFVFKYSNLIINRRKLLSRFGLMHCIAASLCFWVYAILQETLQAIYSKKSSGDYGNYSANVAATTALYGSDGDDDDEDSDEMDDDDLMKMKMMAKAMYTGKAVSASWNINYGCEKTTDLTEMINYTTPYLYPFSIEYNILIVGVWILLWENIGKTDRHTHIPSVEVTYEEDNSKGFSSNMIIYVDCHSSNRGLFAGLLMTVATVISIILFFIFTSSQNNIELGLFVNGYSELLLLTVTAIAGILAYNSVRHLDVIKHHISAVDDILLIICLPCILLYAFFSMVPSVLNGEVLFVTVNVLQVIQATLQTVFIGDGLRRCSNSSSLQQKKPGREVVTFLVVANVAIWLLETFEIKSDAGNANKYDFYGKNLWTLLSHLTLPLALFYRFHSSVCLADMWKASYEPEADH